MIKHYKEHEKSVRLPGSVAVTVLRRAADLDAALRALAAAIPDPATYAGTLSAIDASRRGGAPLTLDVERLDTATAAVCRAREEFDGIDASRLEELLSDDGSRSTLLLLQVLASDPPTGALLDRLPWPAVQRLMLSAGIIPPSSDPLPDQPRAAFRELAHRAGIMVPDPASKAPASGATVPIEDLLPDPAQAERYRSAVQGAGDVAAAALRCGEAVRVALAAMSAAIPERDTYAAACVGIHLARRNGGPPAQAALVTFADVTAPVCRALSELDAIDIAPLQTLADMDEGPLGEHAWLLHETLRSEALLWLLLPERLPRYACRVLVARGTRCAG